MKLRKSQATQYSLPCCNDSHHFSENSTVISSYYIATERLHVQHTVEHKVFENHVFTKKIRNFKKTDITHDMMLHDTFLVIHRLYPSVLF